MSKLILPRQDKEGNYYLSYSQISTWLKNKKEYMRNYFFGEDIQFTAYIDFGSMIGKALETNDFSSFTEVESKFLSTIPRLDLFEREIVLNMEGFYVKGFIDTIDEKLTHVVDYKTGTEKKQAEYKKDEYIQPLIYALGIQQETGTLPEKATIYVIDRKGNAFRGEPLELGNEYWEVNIPLTKEKLQYTYNVIEEVAKEISEHYMLFLQLNK